ncbi:hypothetical protein K440DRAFT_384575 [Wilcoxina mikolae CBS 423.85]|nr:hypothetical protein K440DRAFT_384575 [Wilcoxina mikolae CBS 423.85]
MIPVGHSAGAVAYTVTAIKYPVPVTIGLSIVVITAGPGSAVGSGRPCAVATSFYTAGVVVPAISTAETY